MYNTEKKKHSIMKNAMNAFISKHAHEDTKALVIDAETLLSSSRLTKKGVLPSNIVVINSDQDVIEKAKENGHIHSVCGVSTTVLSQIKGAFDIIYLDYCGTPKDNSTNGFSPQIDMWWATSNLKDDGILACTFSRRCQNAIKTALNLIPSALQLCFDIKYCETSAMYTMILTRKRRPGLKKLFSKLYNPKANKIPKRVVKKRDFFSYTEFYTQNKRCKKRRTRNKNTK